jgi:hypothetical protein
MRRTTRAILDCVVSTLNRAEIFAEHALTGGIQRNRGIRLQNRLLEIMSANARRDEPTVGSYNLTGHGGHFSLSGERLTLDVPSGFDTGCTRFIEVVSIDGEQVVRTGTSYDNGSADFEDFNPSTRDHRVLARTALRAARGDLIT